MSLYINFMHLNIMELIFFHFFILYFFFNIIICILNFYLNLNTSNFQIKVKENGESHGFELKII